MSSSLIILSVIQKWNQILDVIEETDPPIPVQLDDDTWLHYGPCPFLTEYTFIITLQDGGGLV